LESSVFIRFCSVGKPSNQQVSLHALDATELPLKALALPQKLQPSHVNSRISHQRQRARLKCSVKQTKMLSGLQYLRCLLWRLEQSRVRWYLTRRVQSRPGDSLFTSPVRLAYTLTRTAKVLARDSAIPTDVTWATGWLL
jgi:hypothetical protein